MPRRLLRRALLSLSGLCLLLCLAVAALGVRSYWRHDVVSTETFRGNPYDGESREHFVRSNRGLMLFARNLHRFHYTHDLTPVGPRPVQWQSLAADRDFALDRNAALGRPYGAYFAGFGAGRWVGGGTTPSGDWSSREHRALTVPHWGAALFFLLAALPFLSQARRAWRRRRRARRHLCPECGYDLRATPAACPECGTAAARDGTDRQISLAP